jgi:acyl-CoA reductase-like NAD-dependent aldehyde dehydrogenase
VTYLSGDSLPVYDKHTQDLITTITTASDRDMDDAISAGHSSISQCKATPGHERQRILQHIASGIRDKKDLFKKLLSQEVGKTTTEAAAEVARAIDTFTIAAEESVRIGGETIPMDRSPRGDKKWGMTRRFPVGLCALIAPFNFPLNLAAHKIAPAIAAGCPFILKPASLTPLTALLLKDILATARLPAGSWSILPASREVADPLITDPRIALLSFTGSPEIGWDMKKRAGKKKVVLELGGNAACIVDETADLDIVIPKIVAAAFGQAGQSCISVQRVYIHESQFEAAMIMLTGLAKQFEIGPLISKSAADRLASWINEAITTGAMCHYGAQQDGAYIQPTILSQVPKTSPLACQEAFGPVMAVTPFTHFDDALAAVNDSDFGLQAGIFTTLMSRAHQAFETLNVGGVIIGDVPSVRFDHMPYGGIKDSGFGREGVRYAILEDYTYEKILVW